MELISKKKIIEEIEKRLWLLKPKVNFYPQVKELENLLKFIEKQKIINNEKTNKRTDR